MNDEELDRRIEAAAREFTERYGTLVADATRVTQERYAIECRAAVSRLCIDAPQPISAGFKSSLRNYLAWLSWVYWNAVNLVVLVDSVPAAAHRLAIAALAYCGGRLVDDGLDGHVEFKGHQATLLGALASAADCDASSRDCAASVLSGTLLFTHAMTRLRAAGQPRLAARIERLMIASGVGALAEQRHAGRLTTAAYWKIVRRKCVDYNMMLYAAVLCGAGAADRRRILRPLAEMDVVAQLVNDLGDREPDRGSGQLNAFAEGVFRVDDASAMLQARRRRIWTSVAGANDRALGVVAVMLDHLRSPRAHPGHRRPGVARRLDRGIDTGVAYLASAQMENGEFATYWSETRNLGPVPRHRSSPFATALTLFCLADVPQAAIDRRQALRFLAARRDASGLVRFLEEGIDPDLDDTALVNHVLLTNRFDRWPYRDLALTLAAMERRDGLFPTWVRADASAANDVDPCVTANVLRLAAATHVAIDDAALALRRTVLAAADGNGTLYYESPAALPFFVATLPDVVRTRIATNAELKNVARALSDRFIADRSRSPIDVSMTLTVASLRGLSVDVRDELAVLLLECQDERGAWPPWAAFRAFNYWGSAALTTALAVQALVTHRSARV